VVVFVLMPSVFVIVMMMCHNLSKVFDFAAKLRLSACNWVAKANTRAKNLPKTGTKLPFATKSGIF